MTLEIVFILTLLAAAINLTISGFSLWLTARIFKVRGVGFGRAVLFCVPILAVNTFLLSIHYLFSFHLSALMIGSANFLVVIVLVRLTLRTRPVPDHSGEGYLLPW